MFNEWRNQRVYGSYLASVAVTWGSKRVVYGACISSQLQGRPAAGFD